MIKDVSPLALVATTAFVVACCASDIRTRRIPNLLSMSATVAGFALNGWLFGAAGLVRSTGGFLFVVLVLLGPFALGGIGGGDVKMMGAVGALTGPKVAFWALLSGLVIGGVVVCLHLARIGRLSEKIRATYQMFAAALVSGSLQPLRLSKSSSQTVALPYSIPLAMGTLVALVAYGLPEGAS